MKHILFSFHTCPLEEPGEGLAGGMNVFLRGLVSGLARQGIETDVVTRAKGAKMRVTRPYRGVRVVHVPCGWEEPATRESAFRALPRFIEKAGEILRARADPPDAISAHYWMSGVAAREVVRAWESPPGLVFAYHTVEARKPGGAAVVSAVLSAARTSSEKRLSREARRVVFLSEFDRAATAAVLPAAARKGEVIPPGVDDAFRRPPGREEGRRAFGIPPGAFLFVLAARLDPGKNVSAAVEAFLSLRGRRRRPILLVAGQGPPAGRVPRGVRFAGPVPHAKMPALFSAADAVLCPSEYESFGLVPLEAMAAGAPVIVPRDGYWGKTVRREGGGVTYPPDAPDGMAEAMSGFLEGAVPGERMSTEGRRIAARFTWEKCTDSWARLLSPAARRGSRR